MKGKGKLVAVLSVTGAVPNIQMLNVKVIG